MGNDTKSKRTSVSCQHPSLRSFTFSTGETIKLCPDCGRKRGHKVLRAGCVDRPKAEMIQFYDLMLNREGLNIWRGGLAGGRLRYGAQYITRQGEDGEEHEAFVIRGDPRAEEAEVGISGDMFFAERGFNYDLHEKLQWPRHPEQQMRRDRRKDTREQTIALFLRNGWDVRHHRPRYVGFGTEYERKIQAFAPKTRPKLLKRRKKPEVVLAECALSEGNVKGIVTSTNHVHRSPRP